MLITFALPSIHRGSGWASQTSRLDFASSAATVGREDKVGQLRFHLQTMARCMRVFYLRASDVSRPQTQRHFPQRIWKVPRLQSSAHSLVFAAL